MSQKSGKIKGESFWIEVLKTIGLSVFLAFGIRTFGASAYFIPTGSMEPTLQVNDRLMVEKLSYRFKSPERGDIVVFTPPKTAPIACGNPQSSRDSWIKRVIGVPGDKVEVKGETVYINSHPLQEHYIASKPQYDLPSMTVPPNTYLVLGDNRNNSCDSHVWGFLPRNQIIGRAFVGFWPPNRIGGFNQRPKFTDQ
ncbi:signal peptidase I [Calothrix sp. 336/3]|uniref:signal peptidase I n=1 Tax=Calothrix sp. 336/3 TaxID=1337936 RepID=UPI0005500FDE|nr:signal peptidase I [Calothrix sp. 336/3]AKG19996.1 signal peptidase I [Calothrix sp. 336/3]